MSQGPSSLTTVPSVHILTQYLWPDDAPTGIYAEQVADSLTDSGVPTTLVGGRGRYREGARQQPCTRIKRISHYQGRRGSILATAIEYLSVARAFRKYVKTEVSAGDVVVITSAPPTTITLLRSIRARGAIGIYWLQDYYPALVRGLFDVPGSVVWALERYFDRALARWQHVVKAAGNLGYSGPNATVIRNWNTLDLGPELPVRPGTALYSGNLGYAQHLPSFIALCESLRQRGYEVTVRGDGPGIASLPDWIVRAPLLADPRDLVRSYWEFEIHLVAGHPELPGAVFPSKFWNSWATGREVLVSGFTGPMREELRLAEATEMATHLPEWRRFVLSVLRGSREEECRA
jgi:hypothetical protein